METAHPHRNQYERLAQAIEAFASDLAREIVPTIGWGVVVRATRLLTEKMHHGGSCHPKRLMKGRI